MANIFDKGIILKLSISLPGNSKKVPTSKIEVDADKKMLRVSKELLDCPEFDAIKSLTSKLRSEIREIAVPSPMGDGHYLIPIPEVQRIDQLVLTGQEKLRMDLLPAMMAAYTDRVRESMKRLNGLGNQSDYPTPARFEAAFGIEHSYQTYGTPATLEAISKDIFDRETAKAQQQVIEASNAIVDVIATEFLELLDDLAERTSDRDKGAKVKFKGLLENIDKFVSRIPVRNLVDNEKLNELSTKAKQMLEGIDSDTLIKSKNIRAYVQKTVASMKEELTTVSLRPKRFIEAPSAVATAA